MEDDGIKIRYGGKNGSVHWLDPDCFVHGTGFVCSLHRGHCSNATSESDREKQG